MRWKFLSHTTRRMNRKKWHIVFAFMPHRLATPYDSGDIRPESPVGDDIVWLESIARRRIIKPSEVNSEWQYAWPSILLTTQSGKLP